MAEADCVEAEDGRLPAHLAAPLEARLQDALDHPTRRRVLRVLIGGGRPRCLAELAEELEGCESSRLSYHLRVLCQAAVVSSEQGYFGPGKGHALYASEVSAHPQVISVLEATEGWDREQRMAAVSERTSSLTMFRLPRPGPTIRLRSRSRTESDR